MCIALLSTAHPRYPFILLSNRDEFLSRPTARSAFWEHPGDHVLAGRDLEREERGTWLGITKDGRIAVLTNFKEEGVEVAKGKSRGGIVKSWVLPNANDALSTEAYARYMIDDQGIQDVGGFSLIFGRLRARMHNGLAVISNRSIDPEALPRLCATTGETHGLSNSHYGDLTWPKVIHGEMLLKQAIHADVARDHDQETFIKSLFDILTVDTLPRKKEGEDSFAYLRQLRNSIFIPAFSGSTVEDNRADSLAAADTNETTVLTPKAPASQVYGTQKQTVILVDEGGSVTWIERTLYDKNLKRVDDPAGDARYTFDIEKWTE